MGVPHLFEDRYFSVDPVDIRLIFYLVLLENLDGHFVASDLMRSLFNFAERALPLGLANNEAADLLSLGVLFLLVLGVLFALCSIFFHLLTVLFGTVVLIILGYFDRSLPIYVIEVVAGSSLPRFLPGRVFVLLFSTFLYIYRRGLINQIRPAWLRGRTTLQPILKFPLRKEN